MQVSGRYRGTEWREGKGNEWCVDVNGGPGNCPLAVLARLREYEGTMQRRNETGE